MHNCLKVGISVIKHFINIVADLIFICATFISISFTAYIQLLTPFRFIYFIFDIVMCFFLFFVIEYFRGTSFKDTWLIKKEEYTSYCNEKHQTREECMDNYKALRISIVILFVLSIIVVFHNMEMFKDYLSDSGRR